MKILLIGPYPPPHGGVSVHVAQAHRKLEAAGIRCRVVNTDRRAAESPSYVRVRRWLGFAAVLLQHAGRGWTVHVHTNGHNWKSWLVALAAGLAGRTGAGSLLTLHSGIAPDYLKAPSPGRRMLAGFVCSLYTRVICVSPGIRDTVLSLGLPLDQTVLLPAYLQAARRDVALDAHFEAWLGSHRPLFSTTLFFRPEYGFDLLIAGLARLRQRYPNLGCVVMGAGEQQAQAERLVRESQLEENMFMVGDVDHDLCLALISMSDVFLRPTRADGDSISVREALALGVPVVASDTGARPPGAMLFSAGDVEKMLIKIELALEAKRPQIAADGEGLERLMQIYREVAIPEERYVAA